MRLGGGRFGSAWRQREFGYEKVDGRWRPSGRLPSVLPEAWERRIAHVTRILRELDAILPSTLSREDQVNLAVFRATRAAELDNAVRRT